MLSGKNVLQCCVIIFLSSICWCQGARILGIFPMPGKSHYILESTLMKALADASHDVTIVSPFSENYMPKNGSYREIVLTGFIEKQAERRKAVNLFNNPNINPLKSIYISSKIGLTLTENTLAHENMQKLIHSKEKFDAVIVGQFLNDAIKALAHHFGGHLILFSSVGTSTWVNHLVGNPSLPSYTPEMLMSFPARMTFLQRLQNSLFNTIYNINQHLIFYPKQNELLHKYIPDAVDLHDALFNVSLVLLNTHESIAFSSSSVPCMIHIGGFHIKPPKHLPQDLQEFLDSSENGAIYFSLGSNVKSRDLPEDKITAIIKTFSKLKENVLWKFEDETLRNLPKNVKIGKWLPQQDVLAHPKLKLFITHAGYSSTIETVYHGVPIIAVPIFGDQKMNAVYAETGGFGLILPWPEISEDTFTSMIREIIDNKKYKENAMNKSILLKDRQVNPLDNALYWIDYVLRHNGAPHLRVASLELAWYQYYLLDVYGCVLLVIYVSYVVLRKLTCLVFCRRRDADKIKTS